MTSDIHTHFNAIHEILRNEKDAGVDYLASIVATLGAHNIVLKTHVKSLENQIAVLEQTVQYYELHAPLETTQKRSKYLDMTQKEREEYLAGLREKVIRSLQDLAES